MLAVSTNTCFVRWSLVAPDIGCPLLVVKNPAQPVTKGSTRRKGATPLMTLVTC